MKNSSLGMNGFEVCTLLRQSDKPDIPVLFLTAHQAEHDLKEIHDLYRPFAYLDKGGDYGVDTFRLTEEEMKQEASLV